MMMSLELRRSLKSHSMSAGHAPTDGRAPDRRARCNSTRFRPAVASSGSDAADVGVEQRERIAQAIHAVLAEHAEQAHAAAHLDRARAGAAHLLDHLRLIALREERFAPASPL